MPSSNPSISHTTLDDLELQPDSIEPSWILDGDPQTHIARWHTSPDQRFLAAVWTCTAGRFRWHFDMDELVQILEGEVTVQEDGREPVTLRVGDSAVFPAGSSSVWTVPDFVRKHAILRQVPPGPVERFWQLGAMVKQRLRRSDSGPASGLTAG